MPNEMSELMNPGIQPEANPDFPHAPTDWSTDKAMGAAREAGLDLSEDHWEAIKAFQEYFAKVESPRVRELHDALNERFYSRGGRRYLYQLFPGGPIAQGCQLAGLPALSGSADKSFGSVQ